MGTANLVAAFLTNSLWIITGERQTRRIRSNYVHDIMRQFMSWFDKSSEGSLNTRLATDTQLIQDDISEKFALLVMYVGQFIAGFIISFVKGWRTALVMLAVVPVLASAGAAIGFFVTKYTKEMQDAYAHAGTVAEQVFAGIRTVYQFSLQKRFGDLYDSRLEKTMRTGIAKGKALGFGIGVFMFTLFSTLGLAF